MLSQLARAASRSSGRSSACTTQIAPTDAPPIRPGRVGAVSKSKDKVKINFDDGDELVVPWAACHLRDAPRPTFF